MRLELASFEVSDIAFGKKTELANGTLVISKEELRQKVLEDSWFSDVGIHLVNPGDSTRIIHTLDAVQPRYKVEGPGTVFPGFLGPPVTVGQGRTHSLAGVSVVTACEPVPGEPTYWREGIIEMSGPGSALCPFSRLRHVALDLKPNLDDFPRDGGEAKNVMEGNAAVQRYYRAATKAGFKAAAFLAQVTRNRSPDQVEVFELPPCDPDLLKIAFVYQNISGVLYGALTGSVSGTIIHPNESFDGAMTPLIPMATTAHHPTYLEQNNEILKELYRRHGRELNFVGYVLYGALGNTSTMEEKERVSAAAANLTRLLGAQAAVMVGQNDSNLCMDFMMTVQRCERMGIKTTLIYKEVGSGPDDRGFVFSVPEADAIVCVGSREQEVTLPPVKSLIGGTHIINDGADAKGEVSTNLRYILGANNLLALNYLTTELE